MSLMNRGEHFRYPFCFDFGSDVNTSDKSLFPFFRHCSFLPSLPGLPSSFSLSFALLLSLLSPGLVSLPHSDLPWRPPSLLPAHFSPLYPVPFLLFSLLPPTRLLPLLRSSFASFIPTSCLLQFLLPCSLPPSFPSSSHPSPFLAHFFLPSLASSFSPIQFSSLSSC